MKDCSIRTNELVKDQFDELTIIAKKEMKKALEWLGEQREKHSKKKKKDEKSYKS